MQTSPVKLGESCPTLDIMMKRIAALLGVSIIAGSVPAFAQTWDDRLFLNVSVGAQTGGTDAVAVLNPIVYGETAAITTTRKLDKPLFFDVTAGRPLTGNLGVSVSFSTRSSTADGQVQASIPDPVFFERPRNVTSSIADMTHTERWVGVLLSWFVPVGEKSDLVLLLGPAVAAVTHEVPINITATETGGTPTLTATLEKKSRSLAGYQVGADYRYLLTETMGVGAYLGYHGASGTAVPGSDVKVGGFRVGGGVRLRF